MSRNPLAALILTATVPSLLLDACSRSAEPTKPPRETGLDLQAVDSRATRAEATVPRPSEAESSGHDPPIAKRLTLEVLRSTKDEDLWDFIADDVEAHAHDKPTLSGLSASQRGIHAACIVDGEVHNGGFNQLFWNQEAQLIEEAVKGLLLMGAPKHAAVVKKAISVRLREARMIAELKKRWNAALKSPSEPGRRAPPGDGAQAKAWEAFAESYEETKLNPLDGQYFRLDDVEPLDPRAIRYIRNHEQEFVDE